MPNDLSGVAATTKSGMAVAIADSRKEVGSAMNAMICDRKRGIWRFDEKTETVIQVPRVEAPREVRQVAELDLVPEPKLHTGLYL